MIEAFVNIISLSAGLRKYYKVISSENLTGQHMRLMMGVEIMHRRRKKILYNQPGIKWGDLTPTLSQEMGEKLMAMGAWRSNGDTGEIWDKTASCIREATREVLEVSRGKCGG